MTDSYEFGPLEGDDGAETIMSVLSATEDEWWMESDDGNGFDTFAVEALNKKGERQVLVAVRMPVRLNHGTETKDMNMMLHPTTAMKLVESLVWSLRHLQHVGIWAPPEREEEE